MIRCRNCQQDNSDGARFCVACGSPLAAQPNNSFAPELNPYVAQSSPHSELAVPRVDPTQPVAPLGTPVLPPVAQIGGPARLAYAATAPPGLTRPAALDATGPPEAASQHGSGFAPSVQVGATASLAPFELPEDARPILVGFLVSFDANPLGHTWPLHQGKAYLGRLGSGTERDIEVPHATVSSRHGQLFAVTAPCRLALVDLNSTNGTFVNDVALLPGQAQHLSDGDRIRFGLFNTVVKLL